MENLIVKQGTDIQHYVAGPGSYTTFSFLDGATPLRFEGLQNLFAGTTIHDFQVGCDAHINTPGATSGQAADVYGHGMSGTGRQMAGSVDFNRACGLFTASRGDFNAWKGIMNNERQALVVLI